MPNTENAKIVLVLWEATIPVSRDLNYIMQLDIEAASCYL